MNRLKTVTDIYIQRKSLTKETTDFFLLHVVTNQIKRLIHTRNELLEKVKQIDAILEKLRQHYNINDS